MLNRLRHWLPSSAGQGRSADRGRFRPEVEGLEERQVLNAAAIFTPAGQLVTITVRQDGTLWRNDSVRGSVKQDFRPGQTVRVAHPYLDANNKVGVDVVFSDGMAFEYDSLGSHFVGNNILDLSRSRGTDGFRLEILSSTASPPYGPDLTGTLTEFTRAGSRVVDTNVRWASTYTDLKGKTALAYGKILTTGPDSGHLFAQKIDSFGTFLLYNSPDGATQDLTDYYQTSSGGFTVTHVTFGRFAGTYALQYTLRGVKTIGDGLSIKVGG